MTIADHILIQRIAERASNIYSRVLGVRVKPVFIASEVEIVHREVMPLRLQDLLDADESNFTHDIGGIHRHLKIGSPSRLADCFVPRYTQ